jgi:tetratricopeptide (TPR) repeat protein
VLPDNRAIFADTWLIEPVPLPENHTGAGFVLLFDGTAPVLSGSLPVHRIDLSHEKEEVAAGYALFRRYLFEYRAGLTLPLLLLVDDRSCARKVYASIPSETELRADLKRMDASRVLALPFAGVYYSAPRRNYFKLGAAFYWAGYPKLALPYLEETIRANPANWKALLAIARLHEELGQGDQAADAYKRLLGIRGDYADAMDQLGLLAAAKNNLPEARDWFERAIAAQHDHAEAINNLGVLFAKMGKRNDSIAAFRYGIQKAPDDEALYLNLGRVYITMDQREEARAVLNELLQRKPGNAMAMKALAQLEGR